MYFSIDEHEMEVTAIDFVPIVPYKTNVVALAVSQPISRSLTYFPSFLGERGNS